MWLATKLSGLCLLFAFLACHHTAPSGPSPAEVVTAPEVGVVFVDVPVALQAQVEKGLVAGLGFPVHILESFGIHTPLEAQTYAAMIRVDSVIVVHPSASSAPNFLAATVYNINSGELLQETLFSLANSPQANLHFEKWAKILKPILQNTPLLQLKAFAWRLKKENACNLVAALSSEALYQSEAEQAGLHHVLIHCRPALIRKMNIPRAYVLTLKITGMNDNQRDDLLRIFSQSLLAEKALEVASQPSTLSITCENAFCVKGSMTLKMPFDPEIYHALSAPNTDPMALFYPLAMEFKKAQTRAHEKIPYVSAIHLHEFPLQIILVEADDKEWRIDIQTKDKKILLAPQEGLTNYLHAISRRFAD